MYACSWEINTCIASFTNEPYAVVCSKITRLFFFFFFFSRLRRRGSECGGSGGGAPGAAPRLRRGLRRREEGYHLYPGESLQGPSRILIQNKQFTEGEKNLLYRLSLFFVYCIVYIECIWVFVNMSAYECIYECIYTVRKFNWWRYCLALCDEICRPFPSIWRNF